MSGLRIHISKLKQLSAMCVSERIPYISHLAKTLRVARSTVRKYKQFIEESGYSFADFAALCKKEIKTVLRQQTVKNNPPLRYGALFAIFPDVQMHIYNGTASLRQKWVQYRKQHPDGYCYSWFTECFRDWQRNHGLRAIKASKWRITNISEEDLLELKKWRRSNNRIKWAKSVALLDSYQGVCLTSLCSKLEKSPRILKRWFEIYVQKGIDGLRSPRKNYQGLEKLEEMKLKRDRIIELLHEAPKIHDINRASWSLITLAQAYEKQYGEPIGKTTISEYVRAEGYTFRKARRVLTSTDPNYREKLQKITGILSNLKEEEKFFSIDEFGPFSVKIQGGKALTQKGTTRIVPQHQKSKGSLIITGALELSTNQITHFYSEKKNTNEMIKLLDILLRQYSGQRCLYLSWDAASWHIAEKFTEYVSEINNTATTYCRRTPIVKLAPLPASAQFLNVIESVFSGMARAILHNSNYQSVEECKEAINKYFADRNKAFREKPRRAGNKIWGHELVEPCFKSSNNCKDRKWR